MKNKIIILCISLIFCVSCMTESYNLSPLTNNYTEEEFSNISTLINEADDAITKKVYLAEISKLTSSFPNISNKSFNKKTSLLKVQVQNYLEDMDTPSLERESRGKIITTYKEIQNLYSKLSEREKEIVRIHLVKIKTNLTKLKN